MKLIDKLGGVDHLIIHIHGGRGRGKTTLANEIRRVVGKDHALTIKEISDPKGLKKMDALDADFVFLLREMNIHKLKTIWRKYEFDWPFGDCRIMETLAEKKRYTSIMIDRKEDICYYATWNDDGTGIDLEEIDTAFHSHSSSTNSPSSRTTMPFSEA